MPIKPMIVKTMMMIACPRSPFLYLGEDDEFMGMSVAE